MSATDHPTLRVTRTNTILYCSSWATTVDFYRDVLGLRSSFENDWFVEFELVNGAHVSIADAARATIAPSGGAGVTLSWEVADLGAARQALAGHGVDLSEPKDRWGATTVFLHDPEGNRIELWACMQQ